MIMRLLIRKGISLVNDLQFTDGPIYVGRLPRCKVFLPDRNVSRQHAVIYTTNDGGWMIQDLESSNCTIVNDRPIKKTPLRDGDIIKVANFTLEAHLEDNNTQTRTTPLSLDDTVVDAQIDVPPTTWMIRRTTDEHTLHINSTRLQDFFNLNMTLCPIVDQEELLSVLMNLLLEQFDAYHVWGGLRETTSGPITCHCGKSRSQKPIDLENLLGRDIIKQSLRDEKYILLPNFADFFPAEMRDSIKGLRDICSAMTAPISAPAGVYGVIYVNNARGQTPFTYQDMDYLTLVSTQIAAFLEHIG